VQVHPIEPTLKTPGTERLKLENEQLLSNFAFNFNLRRYIKDDAEAEAGPHLTICFQLNLSIFECASGVTQAASFHEGQTA